MALTGRELEIHNMFAALRDLEFEKLENLVTGMTVHPNEIVYTNKYRITQYPGSCVIVPGYSLFAAIAYNFKHIKNRTPSWGNDTEWHNKRFPQLKRIMTTLRDKGQDLEQMRIHYSNNDGSIHRCDEEHTRALAHCISTEHYVRYQFAEFLLDLGCRVDNYSDSHSTIINAISNYPDYDLLYLLIKYGADVNQPWAVKPNFKPKPIDYFERSYVKYFNNHRERTEQLYGKQRTDNVYKIRDLLKEGKSYIDRIEKEKREEEERRLREEQRRKEEEERKKREEEERKKREAEEQRRLIEEAEKNRQKNTIAMQGTGSIVVVQKKPDAVPGSKPSPPSVPEEKSFDDSDKEAGCYLILAMNNLMYITEYGKYLPEEFKKQMYDNIAGLFGAAKHKMSPEALEELKPRLPEYCHDLL